MSSVPNVSYASIVTNTQGNAQGNPKQRKRGKSESHEVKTTAAVEQVLSEGKIEEKAKTLTIQNLKERVKDLSRKTCEDFEKQLKGDFDAISTFGSKLEQKNRQYLRDEAYLPSSAEKVEKYKRRREKDDRTYTSYHQTFIEKTKPVILERKSECEKAIAACEFQKEMLTQLYIGSNNRFRRSYLGQDDLFGPAHRLEQASKSLKSRKSALSVNDKTPVSDINAPDLSGEAFAVYLKAKVLSEKLVKFKEEVLVVQETLLVQKGKESSALSARAHKIQEEAALSYTAQASQFKDLKKEYDNLKRELADRLNNLEESIKRERKISTSQTLGMYLFEKAEIEERIRLIENRVQRIGELLEERKTTFALEESKDASASQETITYDLATFGEAAQKIAEYLSKVVIAKEEIVSQTQTEFNLQDTSARLALFFRAGKNLTGLQEEKAKNMEMIFRDSIEELERTIASYALHINALDQNLEGMQDHLDKAEINIEQRKRWEVNLPKKEEPTTSTPPESALDAKKDEAKNSGGFFSWFSSSKKTIDKQPGEKPITNV